MSRTYFRNTADGEWGEELIDVETQFNNNLRNRTVPTHSDTHANVGGGQYVGSAGGGQHFGDAGGQYIGDAGGGQYFGDAGGGQYFGDENPDVRSYKDNPELICGCCLQMMLLPTTLPCGHSFCRLCLANWYFNSNKKSCPVDSRPWTSLPQVSVTLRNLEETLFPEALRRRQAEVDFAASLERLVEFEKRVSTRPNFVRQASVNIQQGIVNPRNIVYIGGVLVAIILAWRWGGNAGQQIIHKEVLKWNTEDVEMWFKEHGSWTKSFIPSVWKNRIDGYALLTDDKEIITNKFGINDTEKECSVWKDIILMRRNGYKPIKDIWEYKAKWPEKLIRYSCMFGCSPRLMLLIMYFMDYNEGFLPFYNTVFRDNSSTEAGEIPREPSSGDLWWMAFVGFVFPYHMYSSCAYAWSSVYFYIFALVVCFESLTGDIMFAWDVAERKTRYPKKLMNIYIKTVFSVIIPWTWLPSIIADIAIFLSFFPVPLFVIILGYSMIIYKLVMERNVMNVIQWLRTL